MSSGSNLYFPADEYRDRWDRVQRAMAARGYDTLIIWQRGAGTFDRVGDVYWLTNFVMNGSGQDPASEEGGAPYTFCAVLMRRGQEPELHVVAMGGGRGVVLLTVVLQFGKHGVDDLKAAALGQYIQDGSTVEVVDEFGRRDAGESESVDQVSFPELA